MNATFQHTTPRGRGTRAGITLAALACAVTLAACGDAGSSRDDSDTSPVAPAPKQQTLLHEPMSADAAERRYANEQRWDPAHPPVSEKVAKRHYGVDSSYPPMSPDAAERQGGRP